jgi:hypothetical protein
MSVAITSTRCRVRVVNHVTNKVTVVESSRDSRKVVFDLGRIVRQMNCRRDQSFRASMHITLDEITLHFHCPLWWGTPFAAESLRVTDPIREIEHAIWEIGGVA